MAIWILGRGYEWVIRKRIRYFIGPTRPFSVNDPNLTECFSASGCFEVYSGMFTKVVLFSGQKKTTQAHNTLMLWCRNALTALAVCVSSNCAKPGKQRDILVMNFSSFLDKNVMSPCVKRDTLVSPPIEGISC